MLGGQLAVSGEALEGAHTRPNKWGEARRGGELDAFVEPSAQHNKSAKNVGRTVYGGGGMTTLSEAFYLL